MACNLIMKKLTMSDGVLQLVVWIWSLVELIVPVWIFHDQGAGIASDSSAMRDVGFPSVCQIGCRIMLSNSWQLIHLPVILEFIHVSGWCFHDGIWFKFLGNHYQYDFTPEHFIMHASMFLYPRNIAFSAFDTSMTFNFVRLVIAVFLCCKFVPEIFMHYRPSWIFYFLSYE